MKMETCFHLLEKIISLSSLWEIQVLKVERMNSSHKCWVFFPCNKKKCIKIRTKHTDHALYMLKGNLTFLLLIRVQFYNRSLFTIFPNLGSWNIFHLLLNFATHLHKTCIISLLTQKDTLECWILDLGIQTSKHKGGKIDAFLYSEGGKKTVNLFLSEFWHKIGITGDAREWGWGARASEGDLMLGWTCSVV